MPKRADVAEHGHASPEPSAFQELLRWIQRTPVPTARPGSSAADEATGLVILDLSLRLDHVSRVTDNLRVIDKSHVRRAVSLDVDLRGLTPEQRQALSVRRGLSPREGAQEEEGPRDLWVPVSRHSREDLSPVVVRDASDQILPRLTQMAASRALVAGLSRLCKLIRDSSAVHLRAESMWLIVKALESLVEEGPLRLDERDGLVAGSTRGSGEEPCRREALDFLSNMRPELRQSFERLLEVAYKEYVLVVMLPARTSQAHLHFEAPLIPAAHQSKSWRRLAPGREYTIEYHTEIARSLGSYHVTVEVAEEIYVRRYILSSAADQASVAELGREMQDLAGKLAEPESPRSATSGSPQRGTAAWSAPDAPLGTGDLPEEASRSGAPEDSTLVLELEAVLSKLALVGRRRNLEHRQFRTYIDRQELGAPSVKSAGVRRIREEGEFSVLSALARGDVNLVRLDRLAEILSLRPFRETLGKHAGFWSRLQPRDFSAGLPQMARWLGEARLGEDVIVENDPRENGAHAQWRHRSLDFGTPSLEPIRARVFLTLADEKPALVDSVRHMLLGLFAIVFGLGLGLLLSTTIEEEPEFQADALVAVLLLVPGILLSRLDIPSTNSVLGQLRAVPRTVAYLSVTLTSGLAVAVATGLDQKGGMLPYWVVAGLLLVLLGFTFLEAGSRRYRRNRAIPGAADVPWWLRHPSGGPERARRRQRRSADVVFDAIDGPPPRGRSGDPAAGRLHSWSRADFGPSRRDTSGQVASSTLHGRRALRGAELARMAARAVTDGRAGVELQVEHLVAEAAGDEWQPQSDVTETLMVRAGAFTVRVLARPLDDLVHGGPRVRYETTATARRYLVAAPLGPNAFVTPLRAVSFRITLPDGSRVVDLLEFLLSYRFRGRRPADESDATRTPQWNDLTIREVQFPEVPSASPTHETAVGPRGTRPRVVRLSIALPDQPVVTAVGDPPEAERGSSSSDDTGRSGRVGPVRLLPVERLDLTERLAKRCVELNAGLEVADGSTGAGPQWRPVVSQAPAGSGARPDRQSRVSSQSLDRPRRHVGQLLLVTLVGSAAGYDVTGALSLCALVRSTDVDVVSVSVIRLQDQPVIVLVLGSRRPQLPAPRRPAGGEGELKALADFLAVHEANAHLQRATEGRALLVTHVDVPHADHDESGADLPPGRLLWLQWSWPDDHAQRVELDPASHVRKELGKYGTSTCLVHHRVRHDRDGRVRGQARLLVGNADTDDLGGLAHRVELTVLRTLAKAHRSPHEVRLRVVKDEAWLSRE